MTDGRAIPASHRDLLERPLPAVLVNHLSTGRLQVSVVWVVPDGDDVVLSTMAEFAKARHLRERPRATLLLTDAHTGTDTDTAGRWLELRADVSHDPDERPETEHPVTFRLRPVQVATGTLTSTLTGTLTSTLTGTLTSTADDAAGPPSSPAAPDGDLPRDPLPRDAVPLPRTHLDLLDGRTPAVLATVRADGRAHARPAACRTDGVALLVAADDEALADLAADPRATVLVIDPADSGRWLQARCDAQPTHESGATDAVVRLVPRRVVCDAIH